MPTVEELMNLADRSRRQPAIDTKYFKDTPESRWHWSSSPVVGWPEYAWNVDFNSGDVSSGHRSDGGFVRPVRAARARQ